LPGLASTGLLLIILSWNEAFWSLNLTSVNAAPLTVFIASYSSPEGLFWAKLSAASCWRRAHHGAGLAGTKAAGTRPYLWSGQVSQTFTHLISDCDGVLLDTESHRLGSAAARTAPAAGLARRRRSCRLCRTRSLTLHDAIADRLGMYTDVLLCEVTWSELRDGTVERKPWPGLQRTGAAGAGRGRGPAGVRLPRAVASNSDAPRTKPAGARGLASQFAGRVYSGHEVARPSRPGAVSGRAARLLASRRRTAWRWKTASPACALRWPPA
jgi:beta-phosphoglucomutase-like phosphatase (HAD superfamily)